MANSKTTKTTTKSVEKSVDNTKTFEPDDFVQCVSVTAGELIMIGKKTGNLYRWTNYGDTTEVEFQDLKAEARNAKSVYLFEPLLMIEDEDVLDLPEFANVKESYKNAISIEEIDKFFDLPNQQFSSQLKKLPLGFKNTLKSVAVDKLESGKLDSINKIKLLDQILGTELYSLLGNNG